MTVHVLGIAGSLRRGSYNRALLHAAMSLAPEGMEIVEAEIRDIPFYDADREAEGFPEPVRILRSRIASADALLIATPEYIYSVPGVLKNTIDWLSRAPDPPLSRKPTAIMGASTGMIGTARAQGHLRQIASGERHVDAEQARGSRDDGAGEVQPQGELTDERTRRR